MNINAREARDLVWALGVNVDKLRVGIRALKTVKDLPDQSKVAENIAELERDLARLEKLGEKIVKERHKIERRKALAKRPKNPRFVL